MKKRNAAFILLFLLTLVTGCTSVQDKLFDYAISFERNLSDLDLKSIQIEQQAYYYLEREGAGDTIVLIHGFRADKDNWIRFVRELPKPFRIIAIDLPAHGDNQRSEKIVYNPKTLSDGVVRIIDALKLKRFHLIGNSLGGWVAEYYTIGNAGRVASLGLFDAGGLKPENTDILERYEKSGENPFSIKTVEDFEHLQDMAFYEQPFLPWPVRPVLAWQFIQSNDFYESMLAEIVKSMNPANQEMLVKGLSAVDVPIFVLWGEKDKLLPVSLVDAYKRYFPRAETVIMKNCGHMPMVERPAEAAEHYVEFVEKHLLVPLKSDA